MQNLTIKAIEKKIRNEYLRQNNFLQLIASENLPSNAVYKAMQNVLLDYKTAEGYVGTRYHSGCKIIDEIETIAIEKAKALFGAKYVNVQANSATIANQAAITALSLANPKILAMDLKCGGHISHSVRYSNTNHYQVNRDTFLLDYEEIKKVARKSKPNIIIAGSSSYPREIDFKQFRKIADEVGAYLIADIAHIAGLVASGYHNSPIDEAHITTASSYKTIRGPRSGFILMGKDFQSEFKGAKLNKLIDRALFPITQGSPNVLEIVGKAICFEESNSNIFKEYICNVLDNSRFFSSCLMDKGFDILTKGTDNHVVLVNLKNKGMTGHIAEYALEEVGMSVNKNQIPFDEFHPLITSGIRIGSQFITCRGMGRSEIPIIVDLIERTLNCIKPIDNSKYSKDSFSLNKIKKEVKALAKQFPIKLIK